MAGELRYFGLLTETGLTVTARVYSMAGAQIGSDVVCTEVGTTAIYLGDMPAAAAAPYVVRYISAGALLGQSVLVWDGGAEVTSLTIMAQLQAVSAAIAALNDVSAAEVKGEVDTALADYDGPTRAELSADMASVPAAVRTNLTPELTLIDAAISSRNAVAPDNANILAGIAAVAGDVRSELAPELGNMDASVSSRLAASSYTPAPTTGEIEAALLNEGDGQQLIDAIASAIGGANIDQVALVAAIRADLERAGGMLASVPTLIEIEGSTILAKSAEIAGLNDVAAADVWQVAVRTVTGGHINTNADMRGTDGALTATGYTPPANSDVAAIRAVTDALPADIATTGDVPAAADVATAVRAASPELDNLDVAVSSRAAGTAVTTELAAIKERTDNLPDDPASEAGVMEAALI